MTTGSAGITFVIFHGWRTGKSGLRNQKAIGPSNTAPAFPQRSTHVGTFLSATALASASGVAYLGWNCLRYLDGARKAVCPTPKPFDFASRVGRSGYGCTYLIL